MKRIVKRLFFGKSPGTFGIRAGLLRGLRFHVDPNHKTLRLIGFDEREICDVVRSWSGRVETAIDIGANDGWYTLYFATRAAIEKVIACEPEAKCIGQMERNLSENKSRVVAKVSIVPRFVGTTKDKNWITVDSLLSNSPRPCLLKIDVDGGELDVLKSGEVTLAEEGYLLIIETHSMELERDCVSFLSKLGYTCTIVPNGWYRCFVPELRPIAHNRWFYAEKKRR